MSDPRSSGPVEKDSVCSTGKGPIGGFHRMRGSGRGRPRRGRGKKGGTRLLGGASADRNSRTPYLGIRKGADGAERTRGGNRVEMGRSLLLLARFPPFVAAPGPPFSHSEK